MPASAAKKHFHARNSLAGLLLFLTVFAVATAGALIDFVLDLCSRIPLPDFYIRLLESRVGAYLWWLSDAARYILLIAVLCTAPFVFFWLLWWKLPVKCKTCGDRYTITKKTRKDNRAVYTYQCDGCPKTETFS